MFDLQTDFKNIAGSLAQLALSFLSIFSHFESNQYNRDRACIEIQLNPVTCLLIVTLQFSHATTNGI